MAPYRKPTDPQWKFDIFLFAALFLVLVIFCSLVAICARPAHAQDDRVVVTIRDFGQGMTPVVGPYNTTPETILYSENMISLQPGSRQLRTGYAELVDYDDIKDTTTSPIDMIGVFNSLNDSGAVVVAAGGKWFWTFWGQFVGRPVNPGGGWRDTLSGLRQIRPYPAGDSVKADGDSLIGYGTRFVRDAAPGDTVTVDGGLRLVQCVVSDARLYVGSAWDSTVTVSSYTLSRSYVDSSYVFPYFLQSGDVGYTGEIHSPPQVVYEKNDTLRIRELAVVDSFLIDSIYSLFGSDSTRVRSWATTTTNDTFITQIMVVARNKAGSWSKRDWAGLYDGSVQTYYFRFGDFLNDTTLIDTTYIDTGDGSYFVISDTTCASCTTMSIDTTRYKAPAPFYQIAGNDDTSLTLHTWYIDRHLGDDSSDTQMASWNDSIFNKRAPLLQDTIHAGQVEGKWGYIFSAAGSVREVVADGSTGALKLTGGGGVMSTESTSLLEPDTLFRGMHFIHFTGHDLSLAPYSESTIVFRRVHSLQFDGPRARTETEANNWIDVLNARGDTVLSVTRRDLDNGNPEDDYIAITVRWASVVDIEKVTQEHDVQVLADYYLPIRYMYEANDSSFFVMAFPPGMGFGLNDTQQPTTSNWEIVRVTMPHFSGMVEWRTPPQLVGWGDTLSGALVSFSGIDDPWAWSGANDVVMGKNPSDPIIGMWAYDTGELTVFKSNSVLSHPGLDVLSQTDGLVAPRGVVGTNKELYWLDVDGMKRMQRRDFSGYSIEKISTPLDPVFNAWNSLLYGSQTVPFRINPAKRHLSVLTYNQRDNHLYLFFPQGSSTTNDKCLTYSLTTGTWDGYHTLKAAAATWATVRDTARIVMGSPDSALISTLDYTYSDNGSPINATLRGGRLQLRDEQGYPYKSVPMRLRSFSRSLDAIDSVRINVIGRNVSQVVLDTATALLTYSPTIGEIPEIFRFASTAPARYWAWEYKVYGDSSGTIFQPIELNIEFRLVERDD